MLSTFWLLKVNISQNFGFSMSNLSKFVKLSWLSQKLSTFWLLKVNISQNYGFSMSNWSKFLKKSVKILGLGPKGSTFTFSTTKIKSF